MLKLYALLINGKNETAL